MKRKKCGVCGAKVINANPKTNTCDPVCTRAKHFYRTRQEQQSAEDAIDEYNDCMAGHAHLWPEGRKLKVGSSIDDFLDQHPLAEFGD